jgi:ATP/maltotriose-dependent transcriptional regulator MalT
MLAALAEYRGNDEEATSRYEAALALFRELGATRQVGSMLENLADAAFRRGELTRSEALASEALAIGRATTNAKMLTSALVGAAQIASARGEHSVAAGLLAESLARANEAGYWIGWADTLGGCAAVAVAAGQTGTAAQLLAAAMAVCEEIGMPRLLHQAQYRRTLATVQMRLDEKEFALAWSAGRELTHEEVRIAAEEVLLIAGTLADAGISASPAERFGLTPREQQVLRLLVQGQSDKEIGETLFISHRTVMGHVANLLAKLDVPSRTAVAHVADREGLL